MKKTIKILIAIAVLLLVVGAVLACKFLIERNCDDNNWNNDKSYSDISADGDIDDTAEGSTEKATVKPITYEQYNELTADKQEEYYNSFETVEDFFAWYNQAKQEFENNQNYIDINGEGDINLGDISQD